MYTSFLLRYQEECDCSDTVGVHCGTVTVTKVNGRDTDNDAKRRFSQPADPWLITRTLTEVKGETGGNDEDDCAQHFHAIPRCYSSLPTTKTQLPIIL